MYILIAILKKHFEDNKDFIILNPQERFYYNE